MIAYKRWRTLKRRQVFSILALWAWGLIVWFTLPAFMSLLEDLPEHARYIEDKVK